MKDNECVKLRWIFLWAFILSIFIFTCSVRAEDHTVTITKKDFSFYLSKIKNQDEKLKATNDLIETQKATIKTLESLTEKLEKQDLINEKVISGSKDIIEKQKELDEYYNKRIKLYREEVEQLEAKGNINKLEKAGAIASNTSIGCLTGSLFAGVGVVPGCAIGAFTGLLKNFFSDII